MGFRKDFYGEEQLLQTNVKVDIMKGKGPCQCGFSAYRKG